MRDVEMHRALEALELRLAEASRARLAAEEKVRELSVDLERALAQSRRAAIYNEQLLAGVEVINNARFIEPLFAGMLGVLRVVLEFDEAFIVVWTADDAGAVVAATCPRLAAITWPRGKFTERVLAGSTLAIFDLTAKPEWLAVDAASREGFTSALHVPLRTARSAAMLVCVHSERGFFTAERVAIARRFAGLANQALHNAEHSMALEARVTERTAALRAERDFARLLTMRMAQGLVITDEAGLIELANPAFSALVGAVDEESLIGRDLGAFVTLAGGSSLSASSGAREGMLRQISGEEALIQVASAPRPSEDGGGGLIHVITDLRERQRVEAALAAAKEAAEANSRAKSMFLANMSHELRTPLNAIIGYCELLHEEASDRGDVELGETLGRIDTASKVLLETIGNVLDLSKIEARQLDLVRELVDLRALCEATLTSISPLAAQNHNTLRCEVADGLPPLFADPVRLRQILINLLGNACKFTEGGQIGLVVWAEGEGAIVFEVRDTGIGMTEEQAAAAFLPFTQADPTPTRRHGGTGLGLTIARELAGMMGATLTVRSALGVGSAFKLRFGQRSLAWASSCR
jgi:signal transduction histidine kinase